MNRTKIVILDMQPIDPPIGGGRLRLLGLYSGFKNEIDATYVGSYDWRGPGYRKHKLSECLTEINVPLSEEHFIAHDQLSSQLGKNCLDTAFPMQGQLSEEFINRAREEAKNAHIVIFSHQWLFPFVAPVLNRNKQLIVYDSQNCEGLLRVKLYDDGTPLADTICREAVRCEYELCIAADLILACSLEDKRSFEGLYGIESDKIIIVPNGVFAKKILPCDDKNKKDTLRKKLGLNLPTACFIGSEYYPNEQAARLIADIAETLPQYQFVIIGGVGNNIKDIDAKKLNNLIVTGFVEEREKLEYLAASDIAINPMLSGSGTNIKMFDFMAAGLPIVTTNIGARGIENTGGNIYMLCDIDKSDLIEKIVQLFNDENLFNNLRENGRKKASEKYSWEQISYELGYNLVQRYKYKILEKRPYFSVIIPSYERHELLTKLMENIKQQTFRDFEVIIIDQSSSKWKDEQHFQDLDLTYFKTEIKGATKARNTGIRLAKGKVAAFIDDDCIPDQEWLVNAVKYVKQPYVVGVEGIIEADNYDTKTHRVVSNVNFEGIGFMTANLFIRLDILRKINGFDETFDNPHFREDTDLAWRALNFGDIPYGSDVKVLHPSHPRSNFRESLMERNKFFIHDPLLLKKHPQKFADIFVMENHYKEETYWRFFKEGMKRHDVPTVLVRELLADKRVDLNYVPEEFILMS
ncbi:glycosyltransferase [Desulfitobacterium sp. PCE1]|uniref:glycosyltransferase n=1 Tax=Desulfitobacterium sp. PCE1 TaxID=146907 RepID=UPI00038174FD|nr:glycosyltransferase [Desulfitobacterium sp. PCE1]